MGGLSRKHAIAAPLAIAALMTAAAMVTWAFSGIGGWGIYFSYVATGASVTLVAVLIWIFVEVANMARQKADRPLREIWRQLPGRLQLVVLPALVFPIFLASFTTAKLAIPLITGFRWDRYWADVDHAVFGIDPWRLTHALLTADETRALAFFYTVIWGFGLAFSMSLVAICANRRYVAQFFTAMMTTWFVAGFLGAYLLSSAGPVFAQLSDPELGVRFEALRRALAASLPPDNPLLYTQKYLASAIGEKIAVRGGGISAMPSMHVAAATIFCLSARGRSWNALAALFLAATCLGSVHFGYHYAMDGVVGAMIAVGCWILCRAYFGGVVRDRPSLGAPVGWTPSQGT